MSSLSAAQGSPRVAHYAATKAWNLVLGEGLWYELRSSGVDVIACAAGATDTPAYRASRPAADVKVAVQPAAAVVAETFARLGRQPSLVPGFANRMAGFVMQRLLPRRLAVRIMGRTLDRMYGGMASGGSQG
jgi:short-subunit dehydrogenase